MLRALMHYEFTLVDVLVCLSCFLIARGLTGSRWAGYLAVAALYVLAIPLPPLVENNLGCFYFTWHPHATSNLEGAIISSPQTYCALPVIFGVLARRVAVFAAAQPRPVARCAGNPLGAH